MRQILPSEHQSTDNGGSTQKRKFNDCKCKYRAKCFYSKGALLVLVWNLLSTVSFASYFHLIQRYTSKLSSPYVILYISPLILIVMAAALLSGWLADKKFGNYRVSKFSFILLFLGAIINCVFDLVFETVLSQTKDSTTLEIISLCLIFALIGVGCIAYFVTSLQLGLDQMPDASESSITSFIAWFVCSFAAACWIADMLYYVQKHCIEQAYISSYFQMWSLFATLCTSIILISDFLFASKWLIIEPKSPQSLKTIYQVLKFAAKHKAPINRSALTYWEEDIPSRMDLGKSRYGGPFTTEQVEDVKTILRILVVSLSFGVVGFSLSLQTSLSEINAFNGTLPGLTICSTQNIMVYMFTYNHWWSMLITTPCYEFTIYPLVRNKLPSILKRIGITSFLITTTSFLCLILCVIDYICVDKTGIDLATGILYEVMSGILTQILLTLMLEFVCAQSPYNMRGLFTGYTLFLFAVISLVGNLFREIFDHQCTSPYCSLVSLSIKTVLGLIGFILHCILAHWYKRRVRDEIYSPHRVVEEVYNRYLTVPN